MQEHVVSLDVVAAQVLQRFEFQLGCDALHFKKLRSFKRFGFIRRAVRVEVYPENVGCARGVYEAYATHLDASSSSKNACRGRVRRECHCRAGFVARRFDVVVKLESVVGVR